MQHQYWVTKKTVLKKLGTKEDECIVSSDAELDAKLELFQSISESSLHLQKILDLYQERLCFLAQEENALGKFLKDSGKDDETAGKFMISAGKAISYSGQQRLAVRSPLLRLYNEVETFRGRAVSDMRATVTAMEKARTEYRAALSWMKATSAQLDPDTGRGLDNFRKAQRQVKESKRIFDKLTLDVLQKIDLLAAARCNMFSHSLANYQTSILMFANKVEQTLSSTATTMHDRPQFEFSILKELSQNLSETEEDCEKGTSSCVSLQDKDKMLFFNAEYKDEDLMDKAKDTTGLQTASTMINLIDSDPNENDFQISSFSSDLAGLSLGCGDGLTNQLEMYMPSHLLDNMDPSVLSSHSLPAALQASPNKDTTQTSITNVASDSTNKSKKQDMSAWFKLFAELDPLANPDNLLGSNNNQSHLA